MFFNAFTESDEPINSVSNSLYISIPSTTLPATFKNTPNPPPILDQVLNLGANTVLDGVIVLTVEFNGLLSSNFSL